MKYLLLFKDLNLQYNVGFNIILFEQEEESIYKTAELDEVVGTVGEKIFRQYRVIDYRVINNVIYYLLTNGKELIGWVNLKESITIYNKSVEPVKIINSNFVINEVNTALRLDLQGLDIRKVYMSKGFIILNGHVLEAVYLKNTLKGFMEPNDLDHSRTVNDYVNIQEIENFFVDSGFLIEAEDINNQKDLYMLDFFPKLQIGRYKYKGNVLWAKHERFKHEKLNRLRDSLSDLTYSNLLAIHLANSYKNEEMKAKKIIKELIKENQKLIEITEKNNLSTIEGKQLQVDQKDFLYENLYNKLKNSKLGKIQVAYWRYLSRKRRNKDYGEK